VVIETRSAAETEAAGARFAARLAAGDVVLVSGELGSGKTTFVRGAANALGARAPVTSPTFAIGQIYAAERAEIAHLDLYRLPGPDLAIVDDYLTPERIGFVEWPATLAGTLERVAVSVVIEHAGGDRRLITIA
jgi:tRNA threonylcarbamoyladenosine biosynthesis protein TsaE